MTDTCPTCGEGKPFRYYCTDPFHDSYVSEPTCPTCRGERHEGTGECPTCYGTGRALEPNGVSRACTETFSPGPYAAPPAKPESDRLWDELGHEYWGDQDGEPEGSLQWDTRFATLRAEYDRMAAEIESVTERRDEMTDVARKLNTAYNKALETLTEQEATITEQAAEIKRLNAKIEQLRGFLNDDAMECGMPYLIGVSDKLEAAEADYQREYKQHVQDNEDFRTLLRAAEREAHLLADDFERINDELRVRLELADALAEAVEEDDYYGIIAAFTAYREARKTTDDE